MKQYEMPKAMRTKAVRLADAELCKQHEAGSFNEGDPNHPMYNGEINYTRCVGLTWSQLFDKQQG